MRKIGIDTFFASTHIESLRDPRSEKGCLSDFSAIGFRVPHRHSWRRLFVLALHTRHPEAQRGICCSLRLRPDPSPRGIADAFGRFN
jgi:hypothetical protein